MHCKNESDRGPQGRRLGTGESSRDEEGYELPCPQPTTRKPKVIPKQATHLLDLHRSS